MLEWALVENVQRQDLNPVEQAMAYRDNMDQFSATQQQVAKQVGLPRSTIANLLRLLDLCDEVQTLVVAGKISFGHAKVLAGLAGHQARQIKLAKRVVAEGLTVRKLEELAGATGDSGEALGAGIAGCQAAAKSQYFLDVERQMSRAVGARVMIRAGKSKSKGRIVIEYSTLDEFDRIVESLGAKLES